MPDTTQTTNDEPTVVDMSLRGLMKKLSLVAKNPTTFNVYGYKVNTKGVKVKDKLLFSFIHAKEAVVNDYEYLDNDILEKEVVSYSIITQYSIDTIVDVKSTGNNFKPNTDDNDPMANAEDDETTNNETQPITNTNG